MKSKVVVLFVGFMLWELVCVSQNTVSSQIKKVTLFSDQALVRREATLEVKKGLNEILLETEAFSLDKDSLSAKVYGEGSLYSVQFKEIYLKEAPQEKIKKLEERLEELKRKRSSLENQRAILIKKERFLNSLIDFSQVQIPRDLKTSQIDIEKLEKTLGFLGKNLAEITLKKDQLEKEIRELDKEIDVLERKLSSLRRPAQKTKKVIEILFESRKDQKIKIEADYLVYNCSWRPFYKVNVPLNLEEVSLIMFSKIKQKTGEDWKGIKLSISNVIPLKGVRLPALSSWFLDLRRKRAERISLPPDMKYVPKVLREVEKKVAPADFVYALKKELPLSFEYDLVQTLDIESKDKETLLPLFSKTLKGEFFYYAVPKVSPLTFLACETSSDKELLSGPLNVYFGGRFVGRAYLTEKKPGQTFYLNLGADREVKVERKKIKDKIKETFFGKLQRKTIIRELSFKLKIENLKDRPIKIKVLDNIPVSKTDKIVVKDIKISFPPTKENYQDKEGLFLWELKIGPKEEKEINIEFVVTYPKDTPIWGL